MTVPVLRPVTKHCPASDELLEGTNLPFGCVMTPFAGGISFTAGTPPPLGSVPKCLHCGAPQSKASSYPMGSYEFMCKLCLKTSSGKFEDQSEQRLAECMDSQTYGQARNERNSASRMTFPVDDYALPLFSNHNPEELVSVMACPPLWCIVVDGTTSSRTYWNAIESSLSHAFENDMPPFVHIAMFVAYRHSIGIWDLASPVPHMQHYQYSKVPDSESSYGVNNYKPLLLSLHLVPADVRHRSHIEAALRALTDTVLQEGEEKNDNCEQSGPLVGVVIETIIESLNGLGAFHPGQAQQMLLGEQYHQNKDPVLTYAGGRILCLLSGPPAEIAATQSSTETSQESIGRTGSGGFGGVCAEGGRRYVTHNGDYSLEEGNEEHGVIATNAAIYYNDLGHSCAEAALAVDVLVLEAQDRDLSESTTTPMVGLPYLRYLADRSGAPGPLIFSLNDEENAEKHLFLLQQEVLVRTPWHRPMAFGGWLRVRVSPGLAIDSTPFVNNVNGEPSELANLYQCGGMMGPVTSANREELAGGHQEKDLWLMGACDDTSTMTLDLEINGMLKEWLYLDGYGDVLFKPCIQTCFAYTTIVGSNEEGWATVRRMRINTIILPVAHDTETLYSTLDTEALATIIFHKLEIASLSDGIMVAQSVGHQWLKAFLLCVYRSAQAHMTRKKELSPHGAEVNEKDIFLANERLVDRDGELSTEEVLLAQGHECLRTVPLLVFSMLQSDALRPNSSAYSPSVDARCAASAQMPSMTPSVLTRCIVPRLELWSNEDNATCPLIDNMGLSIEAVKLALSEHQGTGGTDDDLVLLLDSPWQIMVCSCQSILEHPTKLNNGEIRIGAGVQERIVDASRNYRAPPPITYLLNPSADKASIFVQLCDALVEDSVISTGEQDFQMWTSAIAKVIQEELSIE